ncbi:MAG: molybdenum cofactor biosynthesis protein MoaE [Nitrospinae bacterium]|nr:molybdenum cofactor biosynthesis protein MoaE [Nitrospinota bacterium]MBF0634497.1 molybdenum cofactor biosynthesis protein MoaE [Nitrospinota bacterium]
MARIQKEDFDAAVEIRRLTANDYRVGGIVTFIGVARGESRGEDIVRLEFECYPEMAEKELNRLEEEARVRFDILNCLVIHRVGEIPAGANIVLIVVTSVHRAQAFDACEWLIDELKKRVPIWKKEYAHSGAWWVEDHP